MCIRDRSLSFQKDTLSSLTGHSAVTYIQGLHPQILAKLQILPAAAAGLVHEAEEGVEVAIVECGHLLCHTVVVGVDVEGAETKDSSELPAKGL